MPSFPELILYTHSIVSFDLIKKTPIIIPILQKKKLRFREALKFVESLNYLFGPIVFMFSHYSTHDHLHDRLPVTGGSLIFQSPKLLEEKAFFFHSEPGMDLAFGCWAQATAGLQPWNCSVASAPGQGVALDESVTLVFTQR